jgi:formyl-CoA transferase
MPEALDDVLVVDLTTEFWSSIGTAMLADFGARVVRIEPLPSTEDRYGAGHGERIREAGWDYRFELANRNKQSLSVDVTQVQGRGVLNDLLRRADVFVTDWSRERLEDGGLDYGALRSLNPGLVYCWATGFGPSGPDRDVPPLDELAAARTGMMPILPQPGQPPVFAASGQMYTAVMLGFGVMTALRHRQRTGEGQQVAVSLFGGNMYGASLDIQAFLAMGGERFLHPVSRLDAGNPMSGTLYPSQDGRWVTLTMPDTDRWWPALAEITGIDPGDPRFDTHEKRCGESRLELIRVFEAAFARYPAAHWRREFDARQLSADVIEEYAFPAADPQARRNRYIIELEHPHLGRTRSLGFPIFMSETPARLRQLAPCAGQHSASVLHDILGYSEDRINQLQAQGIVG